MKSATLILALVLCAHARMACADVRIDEQLSSGHALGLGFLMLCDPVSGLVPSMPCELFPLRIPADGRITSMFGSRRDPIRGGIAEHEGIDIAFSEGALIAAAAKGKVEFAGPRGGCGLTAILDHGAGLETMYCHMSSLGVRKGQVVVQGQRIGALGSTGRATGPHLHFEVHQDGIPIDPAEHLYY